MADAFHDRLEQGDFSLVEALVVEACDADHAAIDLPGKRREDELTSPDRKGIVMVHLYLQTSRARAQLSSSSRSARWSAVETVGANECANACAVRFRQNERDLGSKASQSSAVKSSPNSASKRRC